MGIKTSYLGTTYFVNILVGNSAKTTIYFSKVDNACTQGDEAITLIPSIQNFASATMQAGCGFYKKWDGLTKVSGCLSVISSVFCGLVTIPTEGAAALFCTSIWDYAIDTGAADCLKGVAGAIANELGTDASWTAFATTLAIHNREYKDILTNMLDLFCDKKYNPALNTQKNSGNLTY